jgi:predicted nucleic-acid-binding protein
MRWDTALRAARGIRGPTLGSLHATRHLRPEAGCDRQTRSRRKRAAARLRAGPGAGGPAVGLEDLTPQVPPERHAREGADRRVSGHTNTQARDRHEELRALVERGQCWAKAKRALSTKQTLELEWVLRASFGHVKADVLQVLSNLFSAAEPTFESERALEVALQLSREATADFADGLHFALATKAAEQPLWTLDKRAAKVIGAGLLRTRQTGGRRTWPVADGHRGGVRRPVAHAAAHAGVERQDQPAWQLAYSVRIPWSVR